jgi:hypothetical protein
MAKKQADSKMMDRIAEIENCILGGFVLDDRGNWVSITDKKTSEADFLVHLEAGRVLHNGQWVKFADVKKLSPPQHRAAFAPVTSEEKTLFHPAPAAAPPDNGYPPETKAIQTQPLAPETSENNDNAISSYAVETSLFVIDRSIEAAHGLQSETKPALAVQPAPAGRKTKNMRLVPPSIPTWEKEETQQKKRTIIIGGIIVAAVGITAIVVIALQVLY